MSTSPAIQAEARTILIVDDTPVNLRVVVESLEERGFRVVIAQDGLEGLQRAELVRPHLILLDVMMPEMDGFETCRRLKRTPSTWDIPVIFMTSLTDTEDKVAGFRAGGVDYVSKPLNIEELIARIGTHLTLFSERRQAQARLELSAMVFEQSAQGIVICDAENRILSVNRAFCEITGFERDDVVGKTPSVLASGRHGRDFYRQMWLEIANTGRWQGEIWNRRRGGDVYPEFLSISAMPDADGRVTNYIGMFSDMTQYKQAEENIRRLAHFDALTGLPNRALLNDRVAQATILAQRARHPMALLFLDLDRFKNINDSLGHGIGDEVLVETAKRLKAGRREEDTVSRLGGDEFVLLLPSADADGAAQVAQKTIEALEAPFHVGATELIVTPSIGIAMYPVDGHDAETLIRCADVAMYKAKEGGRNTFRFFTPDMQVHANRTLKLENGLRRALARREMSLHYQPKVDIATGRMTGSEALLRWNHPELGMVSPADFIPVAEDSGQILGIGEWVLRTAAEQIKAWAAAGLPPLPVAVNLSARQFRQVDLIQVVTQVLEENDLPPDYLELELTESITMEDPAAAVTIMDRLHQNGLKLAIDDFGTGYSSLAHLKRFQVSKLKIDQSFVRDITTDPEDKAIIRAIISLARSLDIRTIAEGVETEQQLAFLREQGCDEFQGYYFSRPLPAAEFEVLLRRELAAEGRGRTMPSS